MIRYRISSKDLLAAVDAFDATWSARASTRSQVALTAGKARKRDAIWSDIKEVFFSIQGHKCAYCEKPLPVPSHRPGAARGLTEYDVEHFRPKNAVKHWPTARKKKARGINYDTSLNDGARGGYLRLAFDPTNYCLTCKTCNSELKGNGFPILGQPDLQETDRAKLDLNERPCLLLPIGDAARDPAALLSWHGPLVRARANLSVDDRIAALTIIDFFELDDRVDLIQMRCWLLDLVFSALERGDAPYIAAVTQDLRPFAGCIQAFVGTYRADPAEAKRLAQICRDYTQRHDPALLATL
jgi:hypothetical protein